MSLKIFLLIQGILKLIQVSVVGKYFLFYVPFLNEKKIRELFWMMRRIKILRYLMVVN